MGKLTNLLLVAVVIMVSWTTEPNLTQAQFTGRLDPTNLSEYIKQIQLLSVLCEQLHACPSSAECNNYNSCECKGDVVASADKKTCVPKLPKNEDGSDPYDFPPRQLTVECIDVNSNCGANAYCAHTKICVCNPGYKPTDSDHKTCKNVNPANDGRKLDIQMQGMIVLICLVLSTIL